MSSFRASPWVPYEPSVAHYDRQQPSEMDDDADMEAPQISTLHDEETPPPQSRKKVTLTVRKRPAPSPASNEQWGNPSKKRATDGAEPEEEDQLIDELIDDDDNDDSARPTPSSQPGRPTDDGQKRKASPKKKLRKSDKKSAEGEKKAKERIPQQTGAHILAPTMSIFKAIVPVEPLEDVEVASSPVNQEHSISKARKKAAPRKAPTVQKPKIKLAKQKTAIPPAVLDDAAVFSESYAGTAASSPVTAQFEPEQNSPEPENIPPSSPPSLSGPLPEETNLENVPIPVYPLPTKPFPVQPPQKIPTGTAPLIPLDKSKKHVRHWREANREIRGIAGGRWLARTWVGDKESEFSAYATANAQTKSGDDKASSNAVALPKLSSVSISAPAAIKAVGKLKASSKGGSAVTSANPSRASSATPEGPPTQGGIPITSVVRAPTKMRILQLAPSSEGGDSDAPVALDT